MQSKLWKFLAVVMAFGMLLGAGSYTAADTECDGNCYDQETSSPDSSGGSNVLLKYIRVNSPNGGEALGRNVGAVVTSSADTYTVTWDSLSYGVALVDLLYSTDMGETWQEIALKQPNTGEYEWKLPNINANPVLLRVNAFDSDGITLGSDESNSPFMILNFVSEPDIVIGAEEEYQFQFVGVNNVGPVAEGGLIEVNAVIKNVGKATWHKDGSHPVHLGTHDPNDRQSDFYHSSWLNSNRSAEMVENMVKPGEVATFKFTMQANVLPGVYTEKFAPVVEDLTWMDDGAIEWQIQVI